MSVGLQFRKLDLHVHTNGSHDFSGVTHQDIVNEALNKGLDGIAITDHNTGKEIDNFKKAAKDTGLTVFPGVEITCRGGQSGLHILAIFDPSKDSAHIAGLLSALGIPPKEQGLSNALAKKDIIDAIDIIDEWQGIAIPAHVNSSKGILHDMSGEQRTKTIQHPKLLAVEATDFDATTGKRIADFLDGTDPVYRRKLAVYQASDSKVPHSTSKHNLEGIGSRSTYFKLDTLDIEGLRQCFVHPEARIKLEHEESLFPKVLSMRIGSEGFLKYQNFEFLGGLNSIIGGKGVGKSLAIEFIRFCLDDPPTNPALMEDHLSKLEKELGVENEIEIVYQTGTGQQYKVTRKFLGSQRELTKSDLTCINLDTGREYEGEIKELLPILAYSQTEVIKISENKNAQLELIDRFVDERPYLKEIDSLQERLNDNDRELSKALEARAQLEQLEKDINTLSEQICNIDKTLSNELFLSMKKVETKRRLLTNKQKFLEGLTTKIDLFLQKVHDLKLEDLPESWQEDEILTKQHSLVQETQSYVTDTIKQIMFRLKKDEESSRSTIDRWLPKFQDVKSRYDSLVQAQGGSQKEQELLRQGLERDKAKLERETHLCKVRAENLDTILENRKKLLERLKAVYHDYYDLRKAKFDELTKASAGKLSLALEHAQNKDRYSKRLSELLRGGANAPSVAQRNQIAQNIDPGEFIDLIITRNAETLAEYTGLTATWAQRAMDKLWSHENFEEVLALQHAYYPEDIPKIQYCKAEGVYSELKELSVGQKCTALLMIALSDGKIPVIIDQPEDALDIVSVWEDIGKKLLGGKHSRQFILTTHNSSVAVSADSDQFIVMRAKATRGKIIATGAIDRSSVKKAVIDHLEGGEEPYLLRQLKYKKKS